MSPIRPARSGDEPRIEAFLARYPETSMFLRGNLAAYGLRERTHPHGTAYALVEQAGEVTAVFGRTNHGFLMCQAPFADAALWHSFAAFWRGQTMIGMTGEEAQAVLALRVLDVPQPAFTLNQAEPLYTLDLHNLSAPQADVRGATAQDVALLTDWFTRYELQTGMAGDPGQAARNGQSRARAAPDRPWLRLMLEGGTPVAMADVNAAVADMVQIGGVFVPDALRGAGRAGRVVAALLQQTRAGGAKRAILFANNPAAARAYERIGFQRIGEYRVAILSQPTVIGEPTCL